MKCPGWVVPALVLGLAAPAYSGGLSFVGFARDDTGGVDGIHGASGVAVSPDGAHLYVAGRSDDAVAVFAIDAGTGVMTFVEMKKDGVGGVDGIGLPNGVAVSPDGAHVYVASELDSAVAVFSRNAGTGALTFVEMKKDGVGGVDGLNRTTSVAVSPDGAHVYATGHDDDAVAVFSRNAGTGALTFVEMKKEGVGGVGGLRRTRSVAVSSDGASVYVAGEGSDAVVAFSRNAGTGALTFVELEQDGVGGVKGLRRPPSVTVSPDGATVYAAGEGDQAVVVFSRNAGTSALTYVQTIKRGGEVKGLKGANAVVVSPDNAYVYATGEPKGTVTVLIRDPANGTLRFLETQTDNELGVDGLQGAIAVAVTPDGAHLYAAGREDNSVAAFQVDACGNGNLGTDEQCDDGNGLGGDGCSAVCRLELCAPVIAGPCRHAEPGAVILKMTAKAATRSNRFDFKLRKGETTMLADFGDPTTNTNYLTCVYDSSIAPQPPVALAAPGGSLCKGVPCWRLSSSRYQYKDGLLTPDGLSAVLLREGLEDGRTEIHVQGKASNLRLPPGLPFVAPIVVQVRNDQTGVCWEATFSLPIITTSGTTTKLRASSD